MTNYITVKFIFRHKHLRTSKYFYHISRYYCCEQYLLFAILTKKCKGCRQVFCIRFFLLLLYCDKFCPLCQFLPHYGLNFRKPLLSSQPPLSQSGEKIVLKQGNFREQKKPNPFLLSPPLHSKLGCLLFSVGSLNRGTTLCGSDGRGKALCSPFEVSKMSDNPFQGEVSQLILSLIEQSPG